MSSLISSGAMPARSMAPSNVEKDSSLDASGRLYRAGRPRVIEAVSNISFEKG